MAFYNFTQKSINSLNEIDLENSNNIYYTYKCCDFYYKKIDTSDRLFLSFHAYIPKDTQIPVFRFYDSPFNTLSLFDIMYKENRKMGLNCCTWFLSTKNNNYNNIYIEIMQYFIKPTFYCNVIFHGSSAGGHAALRYAIYFKKKVILTNIQFYPDKHNLFANLLKYGPFKNVDFIDFQIENIVKKDGMPETTLIFINKLDKNHYENHYKPFKQFLTELGLTDKLVLNEFELIEEGVDPHNIRIPKEVNLYEVKISLI